jgi:hypothetical protein
MKDELKTVCLSFITHRPAFIVSRSSFRVHRFAFGVHRYTFLLTVPPLRV